MILMAALPLLLCFITLFAYVNFTCSLLSVQVIHQKPKKTLDEVTRDLCPVLLSLLFCEIHFTFFFIHELNIEVAVLVQVLSIQQLYRISTMYWDDKYGTHSVSSDVCFTYKLTKLYFV